MIQNPTADKVARMFGCSTQSIRAGYAKNAASLAKMAEKARQTGRKVNGYTAEYLEGKAAEYRAKAQG